MAPSLNKLVEEIEAQRRAALQAFASVNDDQFNQSPGQGKWSAAEVFSHIITAERMSVTYLQKKMLGIEQAARSGMWEEVKTAALILTQRMPGLKFKAPQRVVDSTVSLKSRKEIESSWDQVRTDLRKLLEQIPDQYVDRMIYRHVVAGYLNVRHALIFFREHLHHHTPQLNRLQQQLKPQTS